MNPGLHRHFVRLDCLQRNGRKSGSMIMAGGANNTTYPNGERGLFANRPPKILLVFGGLGGTISHPLQGTQTPCQRSAVPSHERNALQIPLRPRSHTSTTNAAATACAGRAVNTRNDKARHGQRVRTRPGPQVRPQKKRYSPQRLAIANKLYICPRERGPICAQRNGSRAAATAGTGRGKWMGGGRAMRMACRRAGDWCRGWPRAIGAGAVGHGTRGGVAACVRKS